MADSKADQVLAMGIVFFVLSWIAVGLRVFVRAGMLKAFKLDDWTMLATQLLFTAYLACQLGGVVYGTGQRLANLTEEDAEMAMEYWYFCEVFYIPATTILKVSIGLFLLRVASQPVHIWIIYIVSGLSALFGTIFFFVVIFQCTPISGFWNLDPDNGQCIDSTVIMALTYTISGLNVIADWVFGILPVFIVMGLQMSVRQKRLVIGLLAFAAIGSTATVVRLPYIGSLAESYDGWNGDFLYNTVGVAIWTTVEVGIGITAACIATLRPLMRIAFERWGINSSGRSRAQTPSHGLDGGPSRGNRNNPGLSLNGLDARHGIVTTITGNHDRDHHFEMNKSWHTRRGSSQERLADDMLEPQKSPRDMVLVMDEVNVTYEPTRERLRGGDIEDEERGLQALPSPTKFR